MKKVLLIIVWLSGIVTPVFGYDETLIHDQIVNVFKDVEAVFSWHVEDRKSLKEVSEDAWQFILS